MLKIKTALKLTPASRDTAYSRQRSDIKNLGCALVQYKRAMTKAKAAIVRVVDMLVDVRKAFDALSDDVDIPDCTKDCTHALEAAMNRIEAIFLPDFCTVMDSTVFPATDDLMALYDECNSLENDRNKVMREYDSHRDEVAKKEFQYQRKSKDLSTSKVYTSEVAKRDKLEVDFEAADQKYREAHDTLMNNRAVACTTALNAFMTCTSQFMESVSTEFETLTTSSAQALRVVQNGLHAEYESERK